MKIPAINSMVMNYRINKETKFLDRYCILSDNLSNEVLRQLFPVRKLIANYGKSKGVTINISKAEKKVSRCPFGYDIDLKQAKAAEEGKLDITVADTQPRKRKGLPTKRMSLTEYVPGDVKATRIHKVPDYIVVADPSEGIEWTRLTSHSYEDGFLGIIYRTISQLTEKLTKKS